MKKTQHGLSLVELLVALVIGAFLAVTVAQIAIDQQLGYLFQRAQADNQSNARFTLNWLDQQLARAGFKRRPDQPLEAAFPALSEAQSGVAGCAFTAGQVIKPLNAKALCIRYQPSDRLEADCLGNGRAANTAALAQPYAEAAEAYVEKFMLNASQQLLCSSKDGAASLTEGIADLRFDFGVGLADSRQVNRYTASPANGEYIRSVRYAALLSAPVAPRAVSATSIAWTYWYGTTSAQPKPDRLYQVVKGTTTLRNLLP
ncbi:type IV pilus assembly protein PilW [Pseudomonas sp. TE3786]